MASLRVQGQGRCPDPWSCTAKLDPEAWEPGELQESWTCPLPPSPHGLELVGREVYTVEAVKYLQGIGYGQGCHL